MGPAVRNKPGDYLKNPVYFSWRNGAIPFSGISTPAHVRLAGNAGNTYLLFYDPAQYGSIYWELVGPNDTYNNFVYVQ